MPLQNQMGEITHPAVTRPLRQSAEVSALYILLCMTYIFVSGLIASHIAKTSQ